MLDLRKKSGKLSGVIYGRSFHGSDRPPMLITPMEVKGNIYNKKAPQKGLFNLYGWVKPRYCIKKELKSEMGERKYLNEEYMKQHNQDYTKSMDFALIACLSKLCLFLSSKYSIPGALILRIALFNTNP